MKLEYSVIPSYSCIPKGMLPACLSEDMSSTHICSKHLPVDRYKCISYTTISHEEPYDHTFNRSLLSAITFLQGMSNILNIFKYFFYYSVFFTLFLLSISKLISWLHLQLLFFFLAPPISPKETASQYLAAAQTPSAPVNVQADQHLAQVACCRGDNEGYEGGFEGSFWMWFLTLHASLTG